jgi:hypothetical protein
MNTTTTATTSTTTAAAADHIFFTLNQSQPLQLQRCAICGERYSKHITSATTSDLQKAVDAAMGVTA